MPTITTLAGRRFDAIDGESMLDAGLRAGVTLPYSCKTGRCGTCKARVRHGSTAAIHDESGLTADELRDGWILTCVRGAGSDVELEVDDLGDLRLPPPRTLPCRVQSIERVAHDVVRVLLRLPPTAGFEYANGQYIDVIGHGGVRRSYSIANAPTADRCLELHVRRVPGGAMSAYWFDTAGPNDLLRLNGPLGTFALRDVAGMDLVFLATGTGIAPVKAMLEGLARQPDAPAPRSITLLWGGRVEHDLYWDCRVAGIDVESIRVLSRADDRWTGLRGHVQHALLARSPDWDRTVVYACGSDAMIHGARDALLKAGMNERRFHSDAFVCSASA